MLTYWKKLAKTRLPVRKGYKYHFFFIFSYMPERAGRETTAKLSGRNHSVLLQEAMASSLIPKQEDLLMKISTWVCTGKLLGRPQQRGLPTFYWECSSSSGAESALLLAVSALPQSASWGELVCLVERLVIPVWGLRFQAKREEKGVLWSVAISDF